MEPGSVKMVYLERDCSENRNDQSEAFLIRRRPVGGGRSADPGRGAPLPPPPLSLAAALSDQLSAQLRPRPHPRQLRLLRRPLDQSLLPGLLCLSRPGQPPPPLLLTGRAPARTNADPVLKKGGQRGRAFGPRPGGGGTRLSVRHSISAPDCEFEFLPVSKRLNLSAEYRAPVGHRIETAKPSAAYLRARITASMLAARISVMW